MDELLQALDVAIVKELLLEVRPWRLGGTTWRRHGHIARRRHLELAVDIRGERYPRRIRVRPGTETASEEGPHSQVSVAETEGVGGEAEEIRRGLIEKGIPGIQGQPFIGRAEAGEQRVNRRGVAGVGPRRSSGDSIKAGPGRLSAPFAVDMACITGGLATEQVVTGHLVCRLLLVKKKQGVEFRLEWADLLCFFVG